MLNCNPDDAAVVKVCVLHHHNWGMGDGGVLLRNCFSKCGKSNDPGELNDAMLCCIPASRAKTSIVKQERGHHNIMFHMSENMSDESNPKKVMQSWS